MEWVADGAKIEVKKLLFQARLGEIEILSPFEFVDHLDSVQNPLASSIYDFYVLIETTGSNESNDKENVKGFLVDAMKSGLVSDGAISHDLNQTSSFWQIREGIPEALQKARVVYKYDLSILVKKIKTGGKANVVGYGHLGDGNLHLNVSGSQYDDVILVETEPFVYEWTSKQYASISAEHGLGLMKAKKIYYSKSTATNCMSTFELLRMPHQLLKKQPSSLYDRERHRGEDAGDGRGTANDLLEKIASLESEAEKSFMHRLFSSCFLKLKDAISEHEYFWLKVVLVALTSLVDVYTSSES
ncbi:D-2-hydroxyglutarate dehydrogenase, mitochondrial-like [Lactuca sativa]|uniref:D-2-hydroxyglutarate dehydrogenase, mitochondrial-like n=1 Tax=Lactuca sativa TaxID=4236 RepID=UPI0022B019F3|nr:D-2-hydroxyglutarate dehydrogenase, mitochondrial-like [Lactuca sativa]